MSLVLRVTNPGQRTAIENYTMAQTFPDIIVFDPYNGDWITSVETITDAKYNRPAHKANVIDRLTQHGQQIEYVEPAGQASQNVNQKN